MIDTHPKATVIVKGQEFEAKYMEDTTMVYEYAGHFERMTHVCIDDAGVISHLVTVDRLLYNTNVFIEFQN